MARVEPRTTTCGIYDIWCGPYFYQGSSKNIGSRWAGHRRALARGKHINSKFQAAFDKYGWTDAGVLVECEEHTLLAWEQSYLDTNWGDEKFLNLSKSAESPMRGRTVPLEIRAKISATLKGRPAPNKGCPASEEAKAKMSESHRKRWAGGHEHSREALDKMSAAAKGNTRTLGHKLTPEHVEKVATANRGKVRSPEAKAKMSESQRKRWAHARGSEP